MKIILKGYYGFGNLGDDILLLSAFAITKEIFPSAEVFICTESQNPHYIHQLLGEELPVITNNTDLEVDWIIHGGGGTYFDFEPGSFFNRVENAFIHLIGYTVYSKLKHFLNAAIGRSTIQAKHRVGLGIGVGTFTKSSKKFSTSILTLSDFSQLLVRDEKSLGNLASYNFRFEILRFTDLAFNIDSWLPGKLDSKKNCTTIGIILRDWPYDDNVHVKKIVEMTETFMKCGYTVKFFSFDKRADTGYIKIVQNRNWNMDMWDPEHESLSVFLVKLSNCSFVITSRAHGAIVSSCLGIPGICLHIEPKLETVVSMLPKSYSLVSYPYNEELILDKIKDRFSNEFRNDIESDTQYNIALFKEGMFKFSQFVNNCL